MSRIEEALKRAASTSGGQTPPAAAPDPTADVFRDPWAMDGDAEPATAAAPPPAARMVAPPEPVTLPPVPPPVPLPVAQKVAAPIVPPVTPPVAPPVPPPAPLPVAQKVAAPVAPPVMPPVAPPVTPPAAEAAPQKAEPPKVTVSAPPAPAERVPAPPVRVPEPRVPEARAAVAPVEEPEPEEAPEPDASEPSTPEVAGIQSPSMALFQGFDPSVAEKIVATTEIRPAFVEQYRKLAGVLHHQQLGTNIKVVMVTSAVAGEGKSLTATNLALTFSESYRRNVLLIDGDLRCPTLHETFQVPNTSGLGDGLRAEREEKLSLVQVSPRLTLLTAGRPDPDPMSGLTSERMRRVIDEAAARFDWIVIDTPPVGLLPDARLLAEMADTTLLVINAGRTPYPFIRRAIDSIGRERIFGVVLNRAEMDALTAGYHYYRYYDSYSKDTTAPPAH